MALYARFRSPGAQDQLGWQPRFVDVASPGNARLGVAAGRLPSLETNADAWPGNIGTGYLREVRNHRQGIAFRPMRAGERFQNLVQTKPTPKAYTVRRVGNSDPSAKKGWRQGSIGRTPS